MVDNDRNKIENIINFYMLANRLKYKIADNKQSLASQAYGAMVLAVAINSEYNKIENLGTAIRMILLSAINSCYHDELALAFKNMEDGIIYAIDLCEYCNSSDFGSHNGYFAFRCTAIEKKLHYFFEETLKEENIKTNNIEELFNIAKNNGITDSFGNDEQKNFEIFRFYYLNRILTEKVRSGWDQKHWNISSKRIETISEHVVGTIALATAFASEFDFDINLDKITTILAVHEVGEINIGDITPFDGITKEEKEEIEHKAIIEVIGNLSNKENLINLIFNFDKQENIEDMHAYYYDKLEADIQSKVYQDMGYHHPLTEQQNNIVFKSSKIQKMLQDGAETAFDIWYEWDKSIYIDEPTFTKVLKYVKDNNIVKE